MPKQEVKTLTQLDQVILTPEALETLQEFQEDSNGHLNDHIEALGDAVCFLARTKMHFDGDFLTESESLIERLSFIRGGLKYLKKP